MIMYESPVKCQFCSVMCRYIGAIALSEPATKAKLDVDQIIYILDKDFFKKGL